MRVLSCCGSVVRMMKFLACVKIVLAAIVLAVFGAGVVWALTMPTTPPELEPFTTVPGMTIVIDATD